MDLKSQVRHLLTSVLVTSPMPFLSSSVQPPLVLAILSLDSDEVDRIVSEEPSEVHALDAEKRSPLHAAAFAGDGAIVRALLGQGKARVDVKDNRWLTPLHRACRSGAEVRTFQYGKTE